MAHEITDTLHIAVAQLDSMVGDTLGNVAKARVARAEAARLGADVLVLSELFVAGYPPEDLVLKPAFQDACRAASARAARALATLPAMSPTMESSWATAMRRVSVISFGICPV